jgi:hypothetical protein
VALFDFSAQLQAELDGEVQVRQFAHVAKAISTYYELRERFGQMKALSLEPRSGGGSPDPKIWEQRNRTYAALLHCFTVGRVDGDEERDILSGEQRDLLDNLYLLGRSATWIADEYGVSQQSLSVHIDKVESKIARRMRRRGLLRGGNK